MANFLVKTTGDFGLWDHSNGQTVSHSRPSVVVPTKFILYQINIGQLEVIARDLDDEVTELDFIGYLGHSGSVALAVPAFLSRYSASHKVEP